MKGQMQTVVLLIITMILLYAFIQYVLYIQREGTLRSAALNAIHVANIMNMLQASPDNSYHKYTLPDAKCAVEISGKYVRFTVFDQTFQRDLIETTATIEPAKIECDEKEKVKNRLCISKVGNKITVKQDVDCG